MKITKNLIALFVIATLGLALSCEENVAEPANEASGTSMLGDSTMTADWQQVAVSDLPQSITDFITENYPDEEIIEAWLTDEGEYVVVLDDDLYLIFDNDGSFVEEYDEKEHRGDRDPIDISELPQSVLDYVTANHPDAEIKKAFSNEDGEYIVKLNNRWVVIFDADGNFIEEFEKERRNGRDYDDWTEVDAASLPQAILDYISANYPDSEIVIAGINADGEYGVVLDSEVILIFDSEGNFLEELDEDDFGRDHDDDYDEWEEVDASELPQAILDYIANNYPDDEIEIAGINEDGEYGVVLSSDIILLFDSEGNFLEAVSDEDWDDDHDDYEDCEEISFDELPQAAKDYLAENHPDDEVEGVWFDEEEQEYIVELSSDVYVIFDIDGNHIETEECDD